MDEEYPYQKNKVHQGQVVAFIFVVLFLFVGMAIVISNTYLPYFSSDFFTFWLAGRLTLMGQDPYSEAQWLAGHTLYSATWIPNSIFPYPLPLALLLVPFGLFSQKTAYLLWVVVTNVFVASSVLLVSKTWSKWNGTLALFTVISAFLFRPYLITVLSGQLVGLFLFVISLAMYFWHQEKWFLGGISVGFLSLKPSYGVLLLILLCIWFLRIRKTRAITGIVVINLILGLAGFLRNPNWMQLFLATGQRKFSETIGLSPTIWSLGGLFCKGDNICTEWVGGCIVMVLLISYVLLISINRVGSQNTTIIVSLAIPLSLLFVPYNWAYDQILLIVSITYITGRFLHLPARFKLLPLFFPFFIDIFALMLLLWAHSHGIDVWSLLLPTLIATIILFFLFAIKKNITLETKGLKIINDDKIT